MRVKHCPKCGSGEIDVSHNSAEYMSSTRYTCQGCDWWYKSGSGMGVGSGDGGVHPREASTSTTQATLSETGSWCSKCEVCAKQGECGCVEENQIGLCEECANYSEYNVEEMLDVTTYFGRHQDSPFRCEICEDAKAELKVV